jgi:DNA-3-methyladenine glycosylase
LRRASRAPAEPAWRDGTAPDETFPESILTRPVVEAARELLGCVLLSSVGGVRTSGVIVETEAYGGPDDPASHACTVGGPTARNRVMFGPPGHAYVYRSYGIHWCMNVVTGADGTAQAVLIRGVEPIEGEETMTLRRGGASALATGPGRLCSALGITDALYGHDLRRAPLELLRGWPVPDDSVAVSPRVGIAEARDWMHRFFVRDSSGVSRGGPRRRVEG